VKGTSVEGGSVSARPGKIAIFEQFAADGITTMFGNPGTSEEGFLDVLTDLIERGDMQYVFALHETAAIGIADGYARASGRPAVVQLHAGVGLGNGIGMMYQAMRGHSPLVVIAGEAGIRYDAMDARMAADLVSMARPVTKWATRVVHPESVLRVLRRAVKIAMTHPRGPVFVGLPLDVLDQDTAEPAVPTTIPSQRVVPAGRELREAADLLRSAQRPVIIIGDGVTDTDARDELTLVAELLNAQVWGSCDNELNMDATHPLYQGQLGHMFGSDSQQRLRDADAVLIAGTYVFDEVFPLLAWPFRPGARIVHIDLDTYEIAKNFPVDIALAADPKPTLAALAGELAADGAQPYPASRKSRRKPELAADAPLLELFAAELARRAPANLVVFDEALTASAALAAHLPARPPGGLHATRGGSLGVGIPGAIGAKLARPDAEVVGFTGDGGSMYTFQSLWTAARHEIAARFVICDNRRYRILDHNIDRYWAERGIPAHAYPDSFGLSHPEIDFPRLASSLGVAAERVDKPAQVEAAVTRMLGHAGPYLVDLNTE
jgi:benzoylformate decarboxylase